MNYTGPKVKLSRRLGIPITPKASLVMIRKPHPPGQHGPGRRGKRSDYGRQLLEKQRLKFQYNLSERQLRNYYREAQKLKGNTGDNLMQVLESRLDAFVLRSGFAPTIYSARQLVSHGHVLVNDKPVNFPSYRLKAEDTVTVREKSRSMPLINESLEASSAAATASTHIQRNRESYSAKLVRLPNREEIPVMCEISQVVEFYSR